MSSWDTLTIAEQTLMRTELIRNTRTDVDILAVAGLFLLEDDPAVAALLSRKADTGVKMRIALTDQHMYGVFGHLAPLLHLQRTEDGSGLFGAFQRSFDRVWHVSDSPIL